MTRLLLTLQRQQQLQRQQSQRHGLPIANQAVGHVEQTGRAAQAPIAAAELEHGMRIFEILLQPTEGHCFVLRTGLSRVQTFRQTISLRGSNHLTTNNYPSGLCTYPMQRRNGKEAFDQMFGLFVFRVTDIGEAFASFMKASAFIGFKDWLPRSYLPSNYAAQFRFLHCGRIRG